MGLFSKSQEATTHIKVNYDGKEAKRGLSSLKKLVGTVVSVYAIKQLATYTWELGKLGAKVENVEKNFANFAKARNRSVDDMMKQLHKATMGMVDDLTLQQRAMQAMVGGVKFDDMVVAMEYVTKFAAATGADVNVKMQTTMTGLARKSAQFLDDIGIQVMGSKDVINDAINQMKEKMDQFTTSEEDASVKADRLNANIKNMKQNISTMLVPAFNKLIDLINDTALGWSTLLNIGDAGENKKKLTQLEAERKEIEEINELIKEQRSIVVRQEQLMAAGKWYDADKLEQAKSNIKTLIETIKTSRRELSGVVTGPPIEPGIKVDPAKAKKARKAAEKAEKERIEKLKKVYGDYFDWIEEEESAHQREIDWMHEVGLNRRLELQDKINGIEDKLLSQTAEGRKELLYREYLESYMILEDAGKNTVDLERWMQKEMTRIDEEEAQKRNDITKKEHFEKERIAKNFINVQSGFINSLSALSNTYTNKELENLEKRNIGDKQREKERQIIMEEAKQRNKVFARMQQAIVIARTISDALSAGVGAARDTFGGPITRGLAMGAMIGSGMVQVAQIQAQNFQRGYLGEVDRVHRPDDMSAMIGRNEAVIPGPQYAMHEDDVRAIVNNTANTATGLRSLRGGSVVNNFYGLSENQIASVMRDQKRRNYIGNLI